jgi:hypothetical protein
LRPCFNYILFLEQRLADAAKESRGCGRLVRREFAGDRPFPAPPGSWNDIVPETPALTAYLPERPDLWPDTAMFTAPSNLKRVLAEARSSLRGMRAKVAELLKAPADSSAGRPASRFRTNRRSRAMPTDVEGDPSRHAPSCRPSTAERFRFFRISG